MLLDPETTAFSKMECCGEGRGVEMRVSLQDKEGVWMSSAEQELHSVDLWWTSCSCSSDSPEQHSDGLIVLTDVVK